MEDLLGYHQEDARRIDSKRALEHTALKYGTHRRELRRKRFEAEFEVWLAELPEEKKKQIAGGVSIGSRAALAMLRSAFAEESGMELSTKG